MTTWIITPEMRSEEWNRRSGWTSITNRICLWVELLSDKNCGGKTRSRLRLKWQSFQFFMDAPHGIRLQLCNTLLPLPIVCRWRRYGTGSDGGWYDGKHDWEVLKFHHSNSKRIWREYWRKLCTVILCRICDTTSLRGAPVLHSSTMYANLITDDGIMTSFQYC